MVRDRNAMFLLTWTAMHEIDASSPFAGQNAKERLAAMDAEIFLSVSGLDETLAQPIHARYRYRLEDIVENARFVDIISTDEDGARVIDFDKFDMIEPVG
jgi:inward rectifier potassium channel